jgi:cytochrome c-type biogenesis protein CcmF
MCIRDSNKTSLPIAGRVDDLGVQLFINQIMPDKQLFDIAFGEHKPAPEYVVMKALDFPYINVLWMGVIVLVVGFSFSLVKRIRKNSQPSEA